MKSHLLRNLGVILCAAAGGACSHTVKVYEGAELPANRLSVIQPTIASGSFLSDVNIRRINGKAVQDGLNPAYTVLPGEHVLNVEMAGKNPGFGDLSASRAINNISFTALPGHDYKVVGDIQDGIGVVWVEDKASGEKVSH